MNTLLLSIIIAISPINALEFVKQEMGYIEKCPVPNVHMVDKKTLEIEYRKADTKNALRQYSKDQEEGLFNELRGLFNHHTNEIYVRYDLDDCVLDSIIVHEMVHYIQLYRDGPLDCDPNIEMYGMTECFVPLWKREIEAYEIQDLYFEKNCK